ncbi:dihydroneopterin aldolase [Sulfurimonas sp.]|nr:dihydroneopterin aldolase [Sulfurimonas sp.]
MTVHIEDLKFQAILGILDFERVTPQDIIVNIEITYTYIDTFINYADVASTVKNQMKDKKFLLIEDALSSLSKKLKKEFSLIQTLDLKITKPSILPDSRVSVSDNYTFNS